jgi:hypothetical protein
MLWNSGIKTPMTIENAKKSINDPENLIIACDKFPLTT